MLNFNAMENVNSYSHSIPMNNGNFVHSVQSQMSASPTPQINMTYLDASNRNSNQSTGNWSQHSISARNHSSSSTNTIENNNNNLSAQNEAIRLDTQKDYHQTTINENENTDRATINMENYMQQKGSENVKRFSVNNLLQLANNCRALSNEHRITVGKSSFIRSVCAFYAFVAVDRREFKFLQ